MFFFSFSATFLDCGWNWRPIIVPRHEAITWCRLRVAFPLSQRTLVRRGTWKKSCQRIFVKYDHPPVEGSSRWAQLCAYPAPDPASAHPADSRDLSSHSPISSTQLSPVWTKKTCDIFLWLSSPNDTAVPHTNKSWQFLTSWFNLIPERDHQTGFSLLVCKWDKSWWGTQTAQVPNVPLSQTPLVIFSYLGWHPMPPKSKWYSLGTLK